MISKLTNNSIIRYFDMLASRIERSGSQSVLLIVLLSNRILDPLLSGRRGPPAADEQKCGIR